MTDERRRRRRPASTQPPLTSRPPVAAACARRTRDLKLYNWPSKHLITIHGRTIVGTNRRPTSRAGKHPSVFRTQKNFISLNSAGARVGAAIGGAGESVIDRAWRRDQRGGTGNQHDLNFPAIPVARSTTPEVLEAPTRVLPKLLPRHTVAAQERGAAGGAS